MKSFGMIFLFLLFFVSCNNTASERQTDKIDSVSQNLVDDEQSFLNNLASLCGQSFAGMEIYSKDGRDSWADKSMVIYFTVCETDRVHIPFHIDDDQSRTWMFMNEDGKLRFRHDHRHEDGTPEDLTLYGGYADGSGTAFRQSFPADDYTNNLLDDDLDRVWNVVLSEDLSKMRYELGYKGEIVFKAEFDLTTPL
jgi:hypothetical protein